MTGRKKPGTEKQEIVAKQTDNVVEIDKENMLKLIKGLHDDGMLGNYLTELGIPFDESGQKDEPAARCGHCHAIADDDGVVCAVCGTWYHVEDQNECSGIDNKFIDLLASDHIWYVCNGCKHTDLSKHRNRE